MIAEPTFHKKLRMFGEWIAPPEKYEFGACELFNNVSVKQWNEFQPEAWKNFAVSGEGVVIKKRFSYIGSKNPYFGKLNSYYIKLPDRVSYEDRIDLVAGEYIGLHAIYTDPNKVFKGTAVYEVNAKTNIIFRKRDKRNPDFSWYVDIVRNSPVDLKNIFCVTNPEFYFVRRDGGGISDIRTCQTIRLKNSDILQQKRKTDCYKYYVKSGVVCHVGDYILVGRRTYKVVKFKQKGNKLQLLAN